MQPLVGFDNECEIRIANTSFIKQANVLKMNDLQMENIAAAVEMAIRNKEREKRELK